MSRGGGGVPGRRRVICEGVPGGVFLGGGGGCLAD
jgi:hypothetical protein